MTTTTATTPLAFYLLRALRQTTARNPGGVDQAQVLELAARAAGWVNLTSDKNGASSLADVLEGLVAGGQAERTEHPARRAIDEARTYRRVRMTAAGADALAAFPGGLR